MMHENFEYWKKLHDNDTLFQFNFVPAGLLWFKIKSIARKGVITDFAEKFGYKMQQTPLLKQFAELFEILCENIQQSHLNLNQYISSKNKEISKELDIETLVDELYKLKTFDWGGDYQNALDKYLISRYVKANSSFDWLLSKLDTEIAQAVKSYVLNSWYNHWTSVLIEFMFKSHETVLPTIGKIKNVDFFINEIPFDLKVTYLPVNFIEKQRKTAGLKPELTFLKQRARKIGIHFKNNDTNLYYQLSEKMKDRADAQSLKTLEKLKNFRLNLIENVKNNPHLLAQNLYEEQGEMRFGAENRIYLVLIDKSDFDNSWKLKRNINLLKPAINQYLDNFSSKSPRDLQLSFFKKGKPQQYPTEYKVLTDVLIIEKE